MAVFGKHRATSYGDRPFSLSCSDSGIIFSSEKKRVLGATHRDGPLNNSDVQDFSTNHVGRPS